MRRKRIKAASFIVASSLIVTSLTGCSSFISEDVTSYPYEDMPTTQELVDYYAKALDYDSIVSRNLEVHETKYETYDVEGEKADKLKSLVYKAEAILHNNEYEITEENLKIVPMDVYEYIKGVIDNEVLSNGTVSAIKGALGYYFVDVKYNISPKTAGEFNQMTSLMGLDGVFIESYDGSFSIDSAYLKTAVEKLNKYYTENNLIKMAVFDEGTGVFRIIEGQSIGNNPINANTPLDNSTESTEEVSGEGGQENAPLTLPGDGQEQEDDETSNIPLEGTSPEDTEGTTETSGEDDQENPEEQNDEGQTEDSNIEGSTPLTTEGTTYDSIVSGNRKIQFDVEEINSVVGSSLRQTAYMPDINTVYNKPEPEGTLSGYGIYASGNSGLKVFGFDRSKLEGEITLRYVFKEAVNGSGDLIGTNIYCAEEDITTGFSNSEQNVLVPDFLLSQFKQLIERADRVQVDYDLQGLMAGHIYEDMGFGVLRGFKENSTNLLKHMSTIRQVVARDTNNNSYLLEVETTVTEGAKSVDCYGTYRDKSYIVVQQQGNEFRIIDQIRLSRQMANEPPINPDSATEKRLVALNLAGEVVDSSKEDIVQLMSELYTAGTNRLLRGPKDIKVNGETITLEKGMYDCFQNDVTMLSTDKLEYMNSYLRGKLTKYGNNVNSTYSGRITEWIGGYDNQVEFTTEELISYEGKSKGYYMQVYYLVSKMNDTWVIDERTIIDESEVEDTEFNSIQSRLEQ